MHGAHVVRDGAAVYPEVGGGRRVARIQRNHQLTDLSEVIGIVCVRRCQPLRRRREQ